MFRRGLGLGIAAALALGIAPATAAGVDRYVDAETGSNANPCSQAAPCQTIVHTVSASSPSDSIRVDSGTYLEQVTLSNGRSLDFQDFVAADGTAPAIIDGGAGTAVTVEASGAGTISDLALRGNTNGVHLGGPAEIAENTFDEPDADYAVGVNAASGTTGSSIHDNTFIDPAPSDTQGHVGIQAQSATTEIRDNEFSAMSTGIFAGGGSGATVIEGNEITGTHTLPSFQGRAIATDPSGSGTLTIRENTISDAANYPVYGMTLGGAATLVRNEISGHVVGVHVGGGTTGVTLEGDRLYDGAGLTVSDNNPLPPQTAVSMTNVTVADAAIFNDGGALTIDSSIVVDVQENASATCAITFSRGDSTAGTDPTGCDDFTTAADPQFVDAAAGNFHLSPGSPMIDAGNPAAPPLGAVDFDGDGRALDATPECSGNVDRRDIGADEFVTALPDCTPPETTIVSGPGEGEVTNEVVPAIGFSSEAGATFQCSENGAAFQLCSHEFHHNLGPLADGPNSFAVRATDLAGNTDLTPDTVSFTVDTDEPETSLTKTPPKRSAKKTVKFKFESDEPGTFTCQLDQKTPFACESPEAVDVKAGRHKFRVTATDAAGNEEPEPAKYGFRRVSG